MKIRTTLLSMLVVAALTSCNKEDRGNGGTPEMGNFEIVLPGAPDTYTLEDPQNASTITPTYTDVTTYLVDAGGNAVKHDWTATEITAKSKRLEQIVKPAKVIIIANKGNVTLPATTTETGLATAMQTLDIETQNSGVANVTLYGTCLQSAFTSETPTDGHTLFKATVELTSLVSRFEVGTVQAGTGLDKITIQQVYVNYYYYTYKMEATITGMQAVTESSWATTTFPDISWATDGYNVAVTSNDGTKCYAYQVFCGDMVPHIIYKVSGQLSPGYKLSDNSQAADGTFSDKFVTVKGFKIGTDVLVGTSAGSGEYQMKVNEIYKMGLTGGGIVITPEIITPNPEMSKVDLIVEVTAAPWTEKTVTPEI